MNYLLSNRSTSSLQTLSRETWSRILGLARFYGWQPMGTLPPYLHNLRKPSYAEHMWDGNYFRNEGQVVQANDAMGLAIALQQSLDDIPDENPERDLGTDVDLPEWRSPAEKAMIRDNAQKHEEIPLGILPFEYFAGDGKRNLIEFIRFCKLGEFVIS